VPDELDALAGQLTERLARLGSALIAFSGGVDSSLVAALAARALGERALAVTAVSPALASDDLGDWRPGLRAAAEHGVRHPLLEASAGKDKVRALARRLGVPSADKPASPCLASRLPYGTPVSADVLSQVDRAELSLKQRGYRELRVRHFGDLGRVQLGAADLPRAADPDEHAAVLACVRAAGYQRAEIDERPLRSGSLNLDITPVSRAG
jgi:pyridinium-3,5-biscarboxylic acid mononucleotide sulfurtransferase